MRHVKDRQSVRLIWYERLLPAQVSSTCWRLTTRAFFLCLAIVFAESASKATLTSVSPAPSLLLSGSQKIAVLAAWNKVEVYQLWDGQSLGQILTEGHVRAMDHSPDEKLIALGCSHGSLGVWHVKERRLLWWRKPSESVISSVSDVNFCHDGRFIAFCEYGSRVLVCDSNVGRVIGMVSVNPREYTLMSAALSPDGHTGILVSLGGSLMRFDATAGSATLLKHTGGWPVRFSSDGRHVVLPSAPSGSHRKLRVIPVSPDGLPRDLGSFAKIGRIAPDAAGGFLVTAARVDAKNNRQWTVVGCRLRPKETYLRELWQLPDPKQQEYNMAFSPDSMLGVATNHRLLTRVVDLQTGLLRLSVDNSANPHSTVVTETILSASRTRTWSTQLLAPAVGATAVVAAGVVGLWLCVRKKRHRQDGDTS